MRPALTRGLACALACVLGVGAASAQEAGVLAPTPPMGWNTWNSFGVECSEALVRGTADAMVSTGMRDAGYLYVIIDDAWSARERDAAGDLVADPVKFPGGIKALAAYVHSRGLKFGIYNCAGSRTCAGYPGGRGHEFQDARRYASWDVDYLKYDWCNRGTANGPETYRIMGDALRASGRPIVFSICEWGENRPWLWAGPVAQLWRTTGDIEPTYRRWKDILDAQVGLERYAGPGHWNDPDMLEVGNRGLNPDESRAHFSLWCMLAAPLIAGNDLRHMEPATAAILTNRGMISIDQDPLGREGFRYSVDKDKEIWAKELSGGEWAVCVLNTGSVPTEVTLDWGQLPFLTGAYYKVTDVWAARTLDGNSSRPWTGRVAAHGVAVSRLRPGY